jgi:hypothetical protein
MGSISDKEKKGVHAVAIVNSHNRPFKNEYYISISAGKRVVALMLY